MFIEMDFTGLHEIIISGVAPSWDMFLGAPWATALLSNLYMHVKYLRYRCYVVTWDGGEMLTFGIHLKELCLEV